MLAGDIHHFFSAVIALLNSLAFLQLSERGKAAQLEPVVAGDGSGLMIVRAILCISRILESSSITT
jgi:hypothetical protein